MKTLKEIEVEFNGLVEKENQIASQLQAVREEKLRLQGEYRLIQAEEGPKDCVCEGDNEICADCPSEDTPEVEDNK